LGERAAIGWRVKLAASVGATGLALALAPCARAAALEGIHKIQHVVVIMQENRSFDSYFGTYPGADGIPAGVCEPDPLNGGCIVPFHDSSDENFGGPHSAHNAAADIDRGAMDGFVSQAEKGLKCSSTEPTCSPCNVSEEHAHSACLDVMGYHDAREIPNYWSYAENYVLQDDMFESVASWSQPEHLFMVSGWSAACPNGDTNPMDCTNALEGGPNLDLEPNATFAWTDITHLLDSHGVSWRYYVFEGSEPDCESDEQLTCAPVHQGSKTPGIWNPLPKFTDVQEDKQQGNIQSLTNFYTAVHQRTSCGLAQVTWIDPNGLVSEHPPSLISTGQAYVTTLINAIMRSPCWAGSTIFLSWDDWGGFYDHVPPPAIDENGYGVRVPGLVVSPYARAGYIDHQQLSHDAYLKFIEDDFLGGRRLNPKNDGRPDRRPDVREEAPGLGSLESDFNFNQAPLPPLILPAHPAPGPASNPPGTLPPSPRQTPPPNGGAPPRATLQLTVSVARKEDLRRRHRRVSLVVGCNEACSIFAHGHLSLRRHGHPLKLRSVRLALPAAHSRTVKMSFSQSTLARIRAALRGRHRVVATIEVDATSAGGERRVYVVRVSLTYR
jgi:phospholipase C